MPVETEILIPDYQPAVFKIVKCLMQPVVLQNRVASGRWHCEGYLRCTVYYQSDEPGCRLYRTEQKFAFEKSVELPDAAFAEGPAQVWGEQEYCNCRAVSEHRIDLRGAYILCAAALMVRNCELLTSLADCGIEQRTQELSGLTRVAAEEKALTSEINLPLPGLVKVAAITTIIAGITGSASGGLTIALELFGETFISWGYTPEIIHRVASIACGGLDTLPWNGTVVMLFALSGVSYKKGYKHVAMETVILPLLSLIPVFIYYSIVH